MRQRDDGTDRIEEIILEEQQGALEESLAELILAGEGVAEEAPAPAAPSRIDGIAIGVLSGFGAAGEPLVSFGHVPASTPIAARSIAVLDGAAVGRQVALAFEGGDPARPIILGLIQEVPSAAAEAAPAGPSVTKGLELEADGERVVLTAEKEIVLRCGKASITLTQAGKILIRGTYLLTRSSGTNRIQGGSVQIN